MECTFLKPFEKLVFDEAPQSPLAFSKRVSRDIPETCPAHQSPAIHLDKRGGLLRVQDMHFASIEISPRFFHLGTFLILLNRKGFHVFTSDFGTVTDQIVDSAWLTFLIPVQSKVEYSVFRAVMTVYLHESFQARSAIEEQAGHERN